MDKILVCLQCGNISLSGNFCGQCGAKMQEKEWPRCECGKPLLSGAYCIWCGKKALSNALDEVIKETALRKWIATVYISL